VGREIDIDDFTENVSCIFCIVIFIVHIHNSHIKIVHSTTNVNLRHPQILLHNLSKKMGRNCSNHDPLYYSP
jgi:hypothetical protein